jgi:hypothetical protein
MSERKTLQSLVPGEFFRLEGFFGLEGYSGIYYKLTPSYRMYTDRLTPAFYKYERLLGCKGVGTLHFADDVKRLQRGQCSARKYFTGSSFNSIKLEPFGFSHERLNPDELDNYSFAICRRGYVYTFGRDRVVTPLPSDSFRWTL